MQISASPTGLGASTAGAGATAGSGSGSLGDLNDAWSIGDTLTDNDKKLVGWDPNSHQVNTLADILSTYRHKGKITGEVTSSFIDAIKQSLASKDGVPDDPALLMAKGAQQSSLSPQTAAALFSILGQNGGAQS